jgi:hypothetical protein
MNRRGFLGAILATCAAPAIVRADSLMRIVPRRTYVLTLDDVTFTAVGGNGAFVDNIVMMNELKAEMLRHAIPTLVLAGRPLPLPRNDAERLTFRRWLPYQSAL